MTLGNMRADGVRCPLLSNNGQSVAVPRMSAMCQKQTHAPQQTVSLFDHLIGDGEQPLRHLDAERSRRLKVDDELEFG